MSDTRWLDADQQRAWRSFLAASRLLFDRLDRQLQNDAGIPHAYYEILVRLSEVPGRSLRMSQLAASAQSSRSRLSHAVARLEEAGWVRRTVCPTDRRGAVAELTDAGFAALAAAAPGHVEAVRTNLFDQLSADQVRQLKEISDALVEYFGEPASGSGHDPPGGDDAEQAAGDSAARGADAIEPAATGAIEPAR